MTVTTSDAVLSAGWPAMGTDAHVMVVGGTERDLRWARDRLDELEARWSRFRPDSELTRLNACAGRPVRVGRDTRLLVEAAISGWSRTGGRFDPTVLPALIHAGYDAPFAGGLDRDRPVIGSRPVPGCAAIRVDRLVDAVTLPVGTHLDLGGIAKGFAADLVAAELVAGGAAGALVNLGGDLRVVGTGPTGPGWTVALDHLPDAAVVVTDGAVATSSTARRTWTRAGRRCHHVIDPGTGLPAEVGARTVTVFACDATEAEVIATAALLAGSDALAVITSFAASGVVVDRDGASAATGDLAQLVGA